MRLKSYGTPIEFAVASAVVTYGTIAAHARLTSTLDEPSRLHTPLVILCAFVAWVMLSIVLSFVFVSPRVDGRAVREAPDKATKKAELGSAHRAARLHFAQVSKWWHYLVFGLGGVLFGGLLARGLQWIFA